MPTGAVDPGALTAEFEFPGELTLARSDCRRHADDDDFDRGGSGGPARDTVAESVEAAALADVGGQSGCIGRGCQDGGAAAAARVPEVGDSGPLRS